MYFHTDNSEVIWEIASALCKAGDHDRSVRFDVDSQGRLKYKIGEGMWTAPFASTPDAYRSLPVHKHTDGTICDAGPAEGATKWCDEHDMDLQ
jgi:hypothetical protein